MVEKRMYITGGIGSLPGMEGFGNDYELDDPATVAGLLGRLDLGEARVAVADEAQARILGANEHESHYVFDLLFNNTTDIQPQVHSTDTHGTNHVNFALLHLFGYQFAPRYRDLPDKVRQSLYGFKHPSQYEGLLLKPICKLNTPLILEEWDNIQRIVVSLALKTTTQSIIVGKLSAHARKNKTQRALWEYDNILRRLYLLDYIDIPNLRQNVQHALNRGENYEEAIALARKGVDLKPDPAELPLGYFLLADLYNRTGNGALSAEYARKGQASAADRAR